jgi:hypothetical protein
MSAPAPLVDATVARLIDRVPELGQVRRAAEFAALQRSNAAPQTAVAAYVLPGGLDAAAPSRATGVHHQDVTRLVSVILFLRGSDPAGDRLLDDIEALMGRIIEALAGWAPPGEMRDPFAFRRARTQPWTPGSFITEFTFAARDRLRVFT